MAKTIWDPAREREIRDRVAKLSPEAPRRWGKMTAPEMLCHLIDGFRVPLGDQEVLAERPGPFRLAPLRWLFVYTLPWPKGKIPTMREFRQTHPEEWAHDLAAWQALCDRFVANGRSASPSWKAHPGFGPLSNTEWGRLVYLHVDHHLRQFGG
ncbi:MAG TPA: hypothetical protein VN783_02350 [Thermoanaerobaculia bacterium]|nr:hypothetical protein [Thermoanaerobaculia bacterium]